ncbi:hypothetical protein [Streptomyces sp. NPDC003006]
MNQEKRYGEFCYVHVHVHVHVHIHVRIRIRIRIRADGPRLAPGCRCPVRIL